MPEALQIIRGAEQASSVLSSVRARILEALAEPGSATSVAKDLGLARQKANYHVRALESHGLLQHVEDRKRGNCTERILQATARHYLIAPSVIGALEARPEHGADRFSSAHLAAICARTLSEVAELRDRAAEVGKKVPTFSLETAVRFSSPGKQAAFAEELANTVAGLVARYHDGEATGGRWFRVLLGTHPALDAQEDERLSAPGEEHSDD